jgi:hypothetical protein
MKISNSLIKHRECLEPLDRANHLQEVDSGHLFAFNIECLHSAGETITAEDVILIRLRVTVRPVRCLKAESAFSV